MNMDGTIAKISAAHPLRPRTAQEPRWVWCMTCEEWIGSVPPLLPPYWSLDKAAGMHVHPVMRVSLAQLVAAETM